MTKNLHNCTRTILFQINRLINAAASYGIMKVFLDFLEVKFALFGFLLEGEDEVGGVVGLFVDFAGEEVVEVVQEWDVEEFPSWCCDRDVLRLYLEEVVGVG